MTATLERAVIEASSGGMSIDDVEQTVIQPAAVSQEHKAALWLLAWSNPARQSPTRAGDRFS